MDQDRAFEGYWESSKKRFASKHSCDGGEVSLREVAREVWYGALNAQGENVDARLASEKWFRDVIASEMGVDAPGGDGCNPLRDFLQELKVARQWANGPEFLLNSLKKYGQENAGAGAGNLVALAECGLLTIRKGRDYNTGFSRDDYFPLGLSSYAQMLWVKCLRLVSFAKTPRDEQNEGVRDTLLDLINYASFAYDWITRRPDRRLP